MDQQAYWDEQFEDNGCIWGNQPSVATDIAISLFKDNNAQSVLIPGAGYGRNSKAFTSDGFDVTGIEISSSACQLAEGYDPAMTLLNCSLFDAPLPAEEFDAVFCFDVLHLFLEEERRRFIAKCADLVKPNGLMFFTVLSENDDYFGSGGEVEPATFEVKPGKYIHFFTAGDLRDSFQKYSIIQEGQFIDSVKHAKHGLKEYQVRYICVRK